MSDVKTRLTLQLATLFERENAIRMIATQAGLSRLQIDFDGPPAEVWTNVVEEAVLQKKLEKLIVCAREFFQDDDMLREAAETLTRNPHAFDVSAAEIENRHAPSHAPQQILTIALLLIGAIILVSSLQLHWIARGAILTIAFVASIELYRRLLPATTAAPASASSTEPTVATIDLDSGMWGGLAGGVVTGALLSAVYYRAQLPNDEFDDVPLITLLPIVSAFFGVAVAGLGVLVAALTSWFARIVDRHRGAWWILNELTASLLAGLVAGVVSGSGIGWQFGQHKDDWAFAGPDILLRGIVPGCVVVGVFIALWDQKLVARRLTRSVIVTTIVAWIIIATGTAASDALKLRDYFYGALYAEGTAAARFTGGMIYGVMIGAISGLVIGISILLVRRWPDVKSATRKEDPPAETPSAA